MAITLLELCRQERPEDGMHFEQIRLAPAEELDACLDAEDCREWFLEDAFKHRNDTDMARALRIVGHVNCPMELASLMEHVDPDAVADLPGMNRARLMRMEPEGEKRWQWSKRVLEKPSLDRLLESYLYRRDIHLMRDPMVRSEKTFYQVRQEILRRTPEFLVDHGLRYPEGQEYLAECMAMDALAVRIEQLSPKYAAMALEREGVPVELLERLSSNKSVVLRKAVAAHPDTPQPVLERLAADKHSGVGKTALDRLPEAVRKRILARHLSADEVDPASGDGRFLTILRLTQADSAQLAIVASEADDLLACAASLHPLADKPVLDALRQRAGLPQWARIGLAMKTERADEIDALIHDGDRHLCIGLSGNPHLGLAQASALMRKLPDDRVLANLANTFIDQPEALAALSGLATAKSPVAVGLKHLLKDTTDEKRLASLQGSHKCRALVLHRLIARHPNCPKKLYRTYAAHLPDDLARNPSYSLAELESARPIKPRPIDKWKIDDYLDNGHAPEFVCDWVLRNDEIGNRRKVISCTHANSNAVRHLAVLDDSHVHRRFVHERAMTYSEYEYRMLVRIGSPSVRKSVVEKGYANNVMLQELAQDKDKSVAMAAQKLAQKRRVPLAAANRVDKSSSKGLGNKAARLDLARESKDSEILSLLAADKLKDVRAEVARREELASSVFLELLKDPEDQVLLDALSSLRHRVLTEAEKPILQERLLTLVADTGRPAQVRTRAMRHLPDPAVADAWYGRENGLFDSEIFATTADARLIDDLLFRLQRGEVVRNYDHVFDNPNLTLEQCETLLAPHGRKNGRTLRVMVRKNLDLDVVVALLENHRELAREEDFSRRDQECSPDQVLALAGNPNITLRTLVSVWRDQLWKLPEPEFRALFERALKRGMADYMAVDKNNPDDRQTYILERLLEKNDDEQLGYFCYRVALTEAQIDSFLETGSIGMRCGIAEGQVLTDAQVRRLENDKSTRVKEALFRSDVTANSRLSSDFLRAYARIDRHQKPAVEEELRLRGEAL